MNPSTKRISSKTGRVASQPLKVVEAGHSFKRQLRFIPLALALMCPSFWMITTGCTLGDLDLHAKDISVGDKDSSRKAIVPVAEKAILP